MTNLSGKVAIVTGGARGIGAAVASHLAADGARVIVNYNHSERAANEVVESIKNDGGEAKPVRADMRDPASIKRLFDQTIETFGRLDILVNNAGIFAIKSLEECSDEDFNDMFNLNVRAVFIAAREAAKHTENGGRIINIGSIAADHAAFPGGSLYGASKAAVAGLTRGWARDLGRCGITVNCVQPGPIDTDMNPANSEFASVLKSMTALNRYGQPAEVAALVSFLASPAATNITGACINVDGGSSA
jgi:3-oxoacyl-[acyl-carrier protein] reductase